MSVRSMTGFGAATVDVGEGAGAQRWRIQVRTVNHRFLDVRFKVPRELVALETTLARRVKERISRGHADVTVDLEPGPAPLATVVVNDVLAAEVGSALHRVAAVARVQAPLSVEAVLSVPGVLTVGSAVVAPEAFSDAFEAGISSALDALIAMREDEGRRLEADLREHLAALRGLTALLRTEAPRLAAGHRIRLSRRIEELVGAGSALDPGRLETEVALMAERSDVSEELARLGSHLDQFDQELGGAGSGKKLEFITQELLREFNTIGSKIGDADLLRLVIDGKCAIEKVREQTANLE